MFSWCKFILDNNPKNAFKLATELEILTKRENLEKNLLENILEKKNFKDDPVIITRC